MLSFYGSIFSFITICSSVFFIYSAQDSWAFREGLSVYKNPYVGFWPFSSAILSNKG